MLVRAGFDCADQTTAVSVACGTTDATACGFTAASVLAASGGGSEYGNYGNGNSEYGSYGNGNSEYSNYGNGNSEYSTYGNGNSEYGEHEDYEPPRSTELSPKVQFKLSLSGEASRRGKGGPEGASLQLRAATAVRPS